MEEGSSVWQVLVLRIPSESAGQLLLAAANEVYNNGGPQRRRGGTVLLDLGPQHWSDLTTPPLKNTSVPPSQAVLFRSSWAASSHNETAEIPIRPVPSFPFPG